MKKFEFEVNVVKYDEDKTDTITNILPGSRFKYYLDIEYMKKIHEKFKGKRSIDIFKTIFGKQQRCTNYSLKNWIWTFSNHEHNATIYCLVNIEGVCWECDCDSNRVELIKLKNQIEDVIINF